MKLIFAVVFTVFLPSPSRAGMMSLMAAVSAHNASEEAEQAHNEAVNTNVHLAQLQQQVDALTVAIKALIRQQETPAERAKEDAQTAAAKRHDEWAKTHVAETALAAKKAREAAAIEDAKRRKATQSPR